MNERIKELAGQAKFMAEEDINKQISYNTELKAFAEKFAELIVQDIFNIMNDQRSYNRCTYTTFDLDKARCITQEITKRINEHFGTKL
jgi:hypothetical protein